MDAEQRIKQLEQRVAALERQVQAQPVTIDLSVNLQDSCFVDYLIQCIVQYQKMYERITKKTKHSDF
ncbi:hypothetical protein ACSVC9_10665 [Clostridium sp. LBM24168]